MAETKSSYLFKQYSQNSEFKNAMLSNQKHYKLPLQMSIYSQLDDIEELGIFKKIQNGSNSDTIFSFYGSFLLRYKKYQYKVFLTLIKILEEQLPAMTGNYSILFFNSLCQGYDAFVSFKNMIKRLPQKYFIKLNNIFIVHPEKSISVIQWLSFGIVNKFIDKIIICIKRINDLRQHQINPSRLYETLPKQIIQYDAKEGKDNQESKLAIKKQIRSQPIKSLSQYELSKAGIPIYLRTLFSYFQNKPQKLRVEGIFRINGNIQDINTFNKQFLRNNFQMLSGLEDPHPICSLIKIFFTSLKDPLFSYQNYEEVIKADSSQYQNLAMSILKKMPILNYRILLIILGFMIYRVAYQQKYNRMSLSNITVCMYPCFFRSRQYKNQDILYTPKFVAFLMKIMSDFSKYFSSKSQQGRVYREDSQLCLKQLRNMVQKTKKTNNIINNLQSKIPSKPNKMYFYIDNQQ